MNTQRLHRRGRGWATTGALLGGLISLAANVAHSFVAPQGAPADWAPKPGAVVGSMVWPILLFFGVEILVSVRWPKGFWIAVFRFGGLLPIIFVAGLVSYRHMRGLLLFYGEEPIVSAFGPIAVDGLMIMATAALYVIQRHVLSTNDKAHTTVTTSIEGDSASSPAGTHRDITPLTDHEIIRGRINMAPHLIGSARYAIENHAQQTGRPIRADELATQMNIGVGVAQQLIDDIRAEQEQSQEADTRPVLNGTVLHEPVISGAGGNRR